MESTAAAVEPRPFSAECQVLGLERDFPIPFFFFCLAAVQLKGETLALLEKKKKNVKHPLSNTGQGEGCNRQKKKS